MVTQKFAVRQTLDIRTRRIRRCIRTKMKRHKTEAKKGIQLYTERSSVLESLRPDDKKVRYTYTLIRMGQKIPKLPARECLVFL